jgi:hypothetical protein
LINYLADAIAVPGTTAYLIPLQNVPQTFVISLGGADYTLTCRWNDADEAGWLLDIADSNSNSLAAGIPLIVGADLLEGLGYLGIDGQLFVYTNGEQFAVPTLANLGVESNLYFTTSAPNGG